MMFTKRTCGLPLICLVCGDTARGINFNLMTCMSCKTFFRRHGTKENNNLQCLRQNNCEINVHTRGDCSACRLQKCLRLGMDPSLVGHRHYKLDNSNLAQYQRLIKKKKNSQLIQACSLSLLENDRSTLTKDEWNILLNIIRAYDATNIVPETTYRLEQQALLPPKLRSKPSIIFDIVKPFYSTFQLLVEHTRYYHMLSVNARKELAHHNCELFAYLNSLFVIRETHAFDYSAFRTGCELVYTVRRLKTYTKLLSQFDSNCDFVKTILIIIAFSPGCATVNYDGSVNISWDSEPVSILSVQNIFVTIFWKYLLYQCGYVRAVRWFDFFVRFVMQVTESLSEPQGVQHDVMLNTAVEEATRLLTIDD